MDWLFQANPKLYDLEAAVARGSDENWAMNQHRGAASVADRVFFWESGPNARLVALGHITSPVYLRDGAQFGKHLVDVVYDYRIEPPLTRVEIASDAALADYKPFQWLMGTNHPIEDAAIVQSIERAIEGRLVALSSEQPSKRDDSQIDLERAIKNAERKTAHALREAVAAMDPVAFEWLVRAVLAKLGYVDIVVTKPSNDGGVDLRARLFVKGVTNIKTAVQAKRTTSVGRPVVQNLRGSLSAHESGVLVTSGQFTEGAEQDAREQSRVPIALIDGSKLVDLMLEFEIGAVRKKYSVYSLSPDALKLEKLKELAVEEAVDEGMM